MEQSAVPAAHAARARSAPDVSTRLSVNLNKVATLRNTRAVGIPSVTHAARLCLDAGACGITLHPRPDQRHIRPGDVDDIAALLASAYRGAELNLEGNPFHNLLQLAERHHPTQCTLVPDEESQATSDHGWDLARDGERLRPIVARMRALGCRVSLFMDPVPGAIAAAKDVGADRVELYTESFASSFARGVASTVLPAFRDCAIAAGRAGLGVNAGHDLNLDNLGPFLDIVPGVLEVSIGHALVADALELGLAQTVRRYLAICDAHGAA
jgi:pyridoxine 5-phosphate synthase